MTSRVVVTLHDVSPVTLTTCARLRDRLDRAGVTRATLLVIPDHHGRGATARHPSTVRWLRERIAAGDEVAQHGHRHRAARAPGRIADRLRGAILSRGEAECLAQTARERAEMLGAVRRRLENALGVRLAGFVAPAWLEPPGLPGALAAAGFAWHETHGTIEVLGGARVEAPVLSLSGGSGVRVAASRAYLAALAPALSTAARWRGGTIRVGVHPCDEHAPASRDALVRWVTRLARRHAVAITSGALGLTAAGAPIASSSTAASRRVVSAAE